MNQDVWTDTIALIDGAIEEEASKLIVVAGSVSSGKTALCACWKKHHISKYADLHEGEKLDMVILPLTFAFRVACPNRSIQCPVVQSCVCMVNPSFFYGPAMAANSELNKL